MAVDETIEALSNSLQNERKWRNVQVVLPESFGLVARVLVDQTQMIRKLQGRVEDLERAQSALVSSNSVTASIAEMEERVRGDFKRRVARFSVSLEQQQTQIQQVKGDADLKASAQLQQEAVDKVEQNVTQRCSKVEERLDQLVESMQHQIKDQELQFKSARIQDESKLVKLRQEVVHKVELLQMKVVESEDRREVVAPATFKEIPLATPEIQEREVVRTKDVIREQLTCDFQATMESQLAVLRQELLVTIGKKMCKSEATKLLSRKMDAMDTWKQLAEKADGTRVEEVACALMDSIQRSQESTMDDIDRLRQLNDSKADALDLVHVKHNMHNILSVAESIQHELSALQHVVNEKMTVADVKELLNSQSTMNGLQEAIKQVESAVSDEFTTKSQFDSMNRQVQAITRQLRSEIYQARYIWKDGCPSAKQTIQWSSQVVNTNADIFLWQFGSDEVKLVLPGLYHLQAAFFTNYYPVIQVLVNGEPAAFLHSTDSKEVTSSQPVVQRLRHSAGNVAGLAVDVFLALPARSQVALSYDIDEKAQGFLNLRKL
ncbi:hypothetical protein V7S43_010913 [Phytophthora oleae]|uniref:TNF family profile domain-containing protein n=1 Tax=Phytophthora oleae TaxID=2107226 RepID=A0ABD3FB81_9STRA